MLRNPARHHTLNVVGHIKNKKMKDTSRTNFLNSDMWNEYEKIMEEKRKTIKSGDNIVHLDYFEGLIPDETILEIEHKLQNVGLDLSRFDKNGVMEASWEDYSLTVFLFIHEKLIKEILKGVVTNAAWDAIKQSLIIAWKHVRNKTITQHTSGQSRQKNIKFGLKVNLDKNTSLNIELKGNVSEEIIEKSLNKVLTVIENHSLNMSYKHPDYLFYDESKDEWFKIDVEEAIRNEALSRINKGK